MANAEQLALIRQDPEKWNQWMQDNFGKTINLREADLCLTNLTGINLSGADLRQVKLRGAKLIEANLSSVDLFGAELVEAELSGANLSGAGLVTANLSGAKLREVNCIDASLSDAELTGVNLSEAVLVRADLSGAKLSNANLCKSKLIGAELRRAGLNEANLNEAKLNEANLSGADLRGANLSGADLRGANLSGADFSGANLSGVSAKFSIVDGSTILAGCQYDDETNFEGVGLDNARIDDYLKARCKRNIRRNHWIRRYKRNRLLNIVRPFWWASDFGSSTSRILFSFIGLSLLFSILYLIPEIHELNTPFTHSFIKNISSYTLQHSDGRTELIPYNSFELCIRALYFSVVTMTTLGFGDMHAHPASITGQLIVMVQVILGYVLLGALITRLSILFQDVA